MNHKEPQSINPCGFLHDRLQYKHKQQTRRGNLVPSKQMANETIQIIRFAQGASNALYNKGLLQARLTQDLAGEAYRAGYETVQELISDPGYDFKKLEVLIFEMLTTQTLF